MDRLILDAEWFSRLLPEGIPIPFSILMTGPGGSGKPLIGNELVASWLRAGGSVLFMSLQYPDHKFIAAGLERVAGLRLSEYSDQVAIIELDTTIDGLASAEGNRFRANVVKPQVWDEAIERGTSMLPAKGTGVLVFVSALNLLLFSPTYGDAILEKMASSAREDRSRSWLMSASTSAMPELITGIESAFGHIIQTRSEKEPFRLYMKIERASGVPFIGEEIRVPFEPDMLYGVKEIADHSRKRVIPLIKQL